MEIDETIPQQAAPEPQLILTQQAQYYLQKAGQWANFISIIGFIGTAFIVIMALFLGTFFTAMAAYNPMLGAMAGMGGVFTVIYLIIAVVSFFFALYLYQFGDKIKKGVLFKNAEEITLGLGKLKTFFKMWGIITIVYIAFIVLAFIVPVILGGAGLLHR